MDKSYTISELSSATGVTNRTIRYYTTEGLLPPPSTRGKFASYGDEHVVRLRLIAQLKAGFLPLSEIKARLEPLTLDEMRQMLADDEQRGKTAVDDVAPTLSSDAPPPPEIVLAESTPSTAAPKSGGLFSRLMPRLREQFAPAPASESWQRFTLAPGVELHVREPLAPDQRTRIERLIAQARELFG